MTDDPREAQKSLRTVARAAAQHVVDTQKPAFSGAIADAVAAAVLTEVRYQLRPIVAGSDMRAIVLLDQLLAEVTGDAPMTDDPREAQAREALAELWLWASERRTHLDTDPVPDGLGQQVLAALSPETRVPQDEISRATLQPQPSSPPLTNAPTTEKDSR